MFFTVAQIGKAWMNNPAQDSADQHIGVSWNFGPPKWLVYHGKPIYNMDDLGVPLF